MKNTNNMYTSNLDNGKLFEQEDVAALDVIWEGDSHLVICAFPERARANIGGDLRKLQLGLLPTDSCAVPGLRNAGVFELRHRDEKTWYRLIYKVLRRHIFVLHCYTKQSNQIEKRDIRTIEQRLANLNQRLMEETRRAKQATTSRPHHKRKRS
jgi:phage-related protein